MTAEKDWFLRLREQTGSERAAALAALSAQDSQLAAAVAALLAADDPGFLQPPALPGSVAGRFRILRELGRGGMGVVYLAEQRDGTFERRLALKCLPRLADPALEQRLRREQRILARLSHPRIARLLDAGTGDDGHPWLAMEYVEGEPLDRAVVGLDLRARLRLFLEIADAVAYAHARLVVHRDLKPGNVLVDAEGQPHLLDFGIAALLDEAQDGSLTGNLGLPFTPRYASPEQVSGEPLGTAVDIHALGVILYELVAGAWPFGEARDVAAQLRAVLEVEMQPLPRGVPRDLEAICARALAKDPQRRYPSVEAFASDLRAFLAGRPVQARRGDLGYRLRKWLRRHAAVLAAVGILFALAVAATSFHLHSLRAQLDRVAAERDKAEALVDFFVGLYAAVEPLRTERGEVSARELLEHGSSRLFDPGAPALAPAARAEMLQALGAIYARLDLGEAAERMFREAIRIRRQEAKDPAALALALNGLAVILQRRGEYAAAAELVDEALRVREGIGDRASLRYANLLNSRAILHDLDGNRGAARARFLEAAAIYRGHLPRTRAELAGLLANLATLELLDGRYPECLDHCDEAEALLSDEVDALRRVGVAARRGQCLAADGDVQAAVAVLRAAHAEAARQVPPRHRQFWQTGLALAALELRLNAPEAARGVLESLLDPAPSRDHEAERAHLLLLALLAVNDGEGARAQLAAWQDAPWTGQPEWRLLAGLAQCREAGVAGDADELGALLAAWQPTVLGEWRRQRLEAWLKPCLRGPRAPAQPNGLAR
jgi:serine/threonine-protein kinase